MGREACEVEWRGGELDDRGAPAAVETILGNHRSDPSGAAWLRGGHSGWGAGVLRGPREATASGSWSRTFTATEDVSFRRKVPRSQEERGKPLLRGGRARGSSNSSPLSRGPPPQCQEPLPTREGPSSLRVPRGLSCLGWGWGLRASLECGENNNSGYNWHSIVPCG